MGIKLEIPEGTRQVPCGSRTFEGCAAPIYWVPYKDKKHPVNPDGTSHYDTCPKFIARKQQQQGIAVTVKSPGLELPRNVVNAIAFAIANGYPADPDIRAALPPDKVAELRKFGYDV
jgi:hypothetical protein